MANDVMNVMITLDDELHIVMRVDEKPKGALTNNMNFDEKLGTYIIDDYSHANAPTVANLCITPVALSTPPNHDSHAWLNNYLIFF